MAPPFAQQTKKTTTQSSTSGGPPGLTSSRRAGPPAPPGKSRDQIAKELDREITRRTYFDGRQDVSDDRLDRRLAQAQEYQKFKSDPTKTKLVSGSTNLYQAATPGGITLAQKQMQLANKYGPTFSEIMSDVTYAGGKVLGALGERAMSGGLGFLGAIKEVANYALNKANQGYNKLNSVQQEVFDNPDKYPYASKVPQVEAVNNSRLLALEAQRDANSFAADATAGILGVDQTKLDGFVNEPTDTLGFGTTDPTVDMRRPTEEKLDPIDIGYVESGQLKEDLQKSGILTVDDPATQEPLPDSTKIPGTNTTLGDLKEELKKQNYNDFQITGIINEMTQRIISGEDVNAPIENIGEPDAQTYGGLFEGSPMRLEIPRERENFSENILAPVNILEDKEYGEMTYIDPYLQSFLEGEGKAPVGPYGDPAIFLERLQEDEGVQSDLSIPKSSIYSGTQVTAFNNPVNLQDVGQAGTTGQTYGNNFAVFPDAETGIMAAKRDLALKTERYQGDVDKIIGEFSPRVDNPDSFDNYVNFVKSGVGETVDPGEEDELLRRVIQFENKPDIANQYLAMVADGGMIDKQLKSLQNGLQNMYNGIPSVKRR